MEEKSKLLKETKEKYDMFLKEAEEQKQEQEHQQEEVMQRRMYNLKMRHNERCQETVKIFRQKDRTSEEKQDVARLLREAWKEYEREREQICPDPGENRKDQKESSLSRNARILAKRCEDYGENTDAIRRRQRLDYERSREETLAEQKDDAVEENADEQEQLEDEPASSSGARFGRRVHGIYEHFDDCPDDPKYSICKHCNRKVSDENEIFYFWPLLEYLEIKL